MLSIKEIIIPGYEKVIEGRDPVRGLHCFIAVHNSRLGPSLGGTRIHPYATADEALTDVLRLAKAMTYKSAVAEDGLGGGKSVIIADPSHAKTPELLHAFAEVIDSLNGTYIAAEDIGSTIADNKTCCWRMLFQISIDLLNAKIRIWVSLKQFNSPSIAPSRF